MSKKNKFVTKQECIEWAKKFVWQNQIDFRNFVFQLEAPVGAGRSLKITKDIKKLLTP